MKKILCAIALLCASVAFGADVTGTWTGTFEMSRPDGTTNPSSAVLVLKQAGQTVTGSAGPSESEMHDIAKGKLDGNKLTFEIEAGEGHLVKFELTVDGDSIKGKAASDDQQLTAKLDVKKKA